MKENLKRTLIGVAMVVAGCIGVAFWVAVGFVVVHFIRKWW